MRYLASFRDYRQQKMVSCQDCPCDDASSRESQQKHMDRHGRKPFIMYSSLSRKGGCRQSQQEGRLQTVSAGREVADISAGREVADSLSRKGGCRQSQQEGRLQTVSAGREVADSLSRKGGCRQSQLEGRLQTVSVDASYDG